MQQVLQKRMQYEFAVIELRMAKEYDGLSIISEATDPKQLQESIVIYASRLGEKLRHYE